GRCATAELGSLRVQRDGQSSFTPLTPHPLSRVPASPPEAGGEGRKNLRFSGDSRRSRETARIAICMTTYNPPPELFGRQIASLRAQTEPDWICLISDDHSKPERYAAIRTALGDDPRFRLFRQPINRGYYHNFEHCLSLAPPDVEFVALADQDDVWHRDKLAVLGSAFGPRTTLAYSDMRIVSADGDVRSPT